MRVLFLLALLTLSLAPAVAAAPACFALDRDVACDVAVSGSGSAHGAFLAVSGTGEATTYMDYCLEWVCPSVALSAYDDAHAECRASSVCVAVAGRGHATHEGTGASAGGCDVLYHVCYPVRGDGALLP